MDELADVTDELYSLPPEQFTAARNAAAAATPSLAAQLTNLKRPSPAAHLANALVRSADLGDLLTLGTDMRSSTDRAELAELTRRRRALVASLVARAAALVDKPPSAAVQEELAQTLQAAIADPAAADALRTGRLVRSLQSVGFGEVDLAGAVAGGAAVPKRVVSTPRDDLAEKRREHARREAAEAQKRAADALASVDALETQVTATERRRDVLEGELSELEERVRETKRAISAADREARSLERERDRAARAASVAADALEAARSALD